MSRLDARLGTSTPSVDKVLDVPRYSIDETRAMMDYYAATQLTNKDLTDTIVHQKHVVSGGNPAKLAHLAARGF
jgi:hypothetical protein